MNKRRDRKVHFSAEKGEEAISPQERHVPDFWEIWHSLHSYLLPLCKKWLEGSSIEPEEALSGAMMAAFEGFSKLKEPIENWRAWLTRVTHNHCMDLHRAGKRWAGGESLHDLSSREASSLGRTESPEDTFLRNELYASMRSAMDQLPERVRTPLILRSVQGLSYKDIAKQLQISTENVRKRVQQAREMLQQNMQGVGRTAESPHGAASRSLAPEERHLADSTHRRSSPELPDDYAYAHPIEWRDREGRPHFNILHLEQRPLRTGQKVQTLQQYVAKFPSGWKKRWELAQQQLILGEVEDARVHLAWITDKQPWFFPAAILLGQLEEWNGSVAHAAALYRGAANHVMLDCSQWQLKGKAEFCGGDFSAAESLFRAAHAECPQDLAPLHALARLYCELGDYPKLHTVCGEVLQRIPQNPTAIGEMAWACIEMDLVGEAMQWLNGAYERKAESWNLWQAQLKWKMRWLHQPESLRQTKAILQKMAEMAKGTQWAAILPYIFLPGSSTNSPNNPEPAIADWPVEFQLAWAKSQFKQGNWEASQKVFAHLAQQPPMSPATTRDLLAFAVWHPSFSLHPQFLANLATQYAGFWEIQLLVGWVFALRNEPWERVKPYLDEASNLQPLLPRVWLWRGWASLAMGEEKIALKAFRKGWNCSLRSQSPMVAAWLALYQGMLENRKPKWFHIALAECEAIAEWDPAMSHFFRAHGYSMLKEDKSAKQAWKEALNAKLPHPWRKFSLGNLPFLKN